MTASINGTGLSYVAASPATGARDLSIATMQKFADEFPLNKTGTGWQKLPSGLVLQWGFSAVSGSVATVSFPMAFPVACYSVVATIYGPNTPDSTMLSVVVGPYSATSFDLRRRYVISGTTGVAGESLTWFAIGA